MRFLETDSFPVEPKMKAAAGRLHLIDDIVIGHNLEKQGATCEQHQQA